jgi:hypothetical protein
MVSIAFNLKIPKQKVKIKIEKRIPHLFFEIKVKNKNKLKATTPNKITIYESTDKKERKNTPNKNPKQVE